MLRRANAAARSAGPNGGSVVERHSVLGHGGDERLDQAALHRQQPLSSRHRRRDRVGELLRLVRGRALEVQHLGGRERDGHDDYSSNRVSPSRMNAAATTAASPEAASTSDRVRNAPKGTFQKAASPGRSGPHGPTYT